MGSDGRVSKDGKVINIESGEGKIVLIKNDISRHFNGLCMEIVHNVTFLVGFESKKHTR